MANDKREYTINIKNKTLVLRTSSYRAEKGSVLHSGIYNRELTSSLVAGGILVAAALAALYMDVEMTGMHYIAAGALFIGLFVLLRLFVFYENYLEAVIDRGRGEVSVCVRGFMRRRWTMPLAELTGIRKGYTLIAPENVDGIKVVEKIALQHGTVIPGFGEVKEYHTVNLEFRNGETPMIFSSEDPSQTAEVLELLNKFAGGSIAQED